MKPQSKSDSDTYARRNWCQLGILKERQLKVASAFASQLNSVQKEMQFIRLFVWILAQAGEVLEYQQVESSLKYIMATQTEILIPTTVKKRENQQALRR